jgi:hypothetical protein
MGLTVQMQCGFALRIADIYASATRTSLLSRSRNSDSPAVGIEEPAGTSRLIHNVVGNSRPTHPMDGRYCLHPSTMMASGWYRFNANTERTVAFGLCFGPQFLGADDSRSLQILPEVIFKLFKGRATLFPARLIDICADHDDSRQAVFQGDSHRSYRVSFA